MSVAALLLSVAAHRTPYFRSDVSITHFVQAAPVSVLGAPLEALNALGFPPLVDIVYGSILAGLFLLGLKWEAAVGAFAVLGSAGINHLVKQLVDRPRPPPELVHVEHHVSNPTYPAGHVLNFTAFAGFLCFLLYMRMRPSWQRGFLIALLIVLIALMGVARVHSGEHWPSDVLGGYLLGAMWLAVTVGFYTWGRRRFTNAHASASSRPSLRRALIVITILAPAALIGATGSARAESADSDSLDATSAVPWNPPHAMNPRSGWEQAVLLPERIVSLPLSGLGFLMRDAMLRGEDRGLIPLTPQARAPRPPGVLSLGLPNLEDGAGFGGAVQLNSRPTPGLPHLSARYTGTLLNYNSTLVTASVGPAALQYGYDWRPQDEFYGVGTSSSHDSLSNFGIQDEFARVFLRWGANADTTRAHPHLRVNAWGGPRSLVTRTGRDSRLASWETVFPVFSSATLDNRVEHLVYGGSVSSDWRSGHPHWSQGGLLSLSAARYDSPISGLALHSGPFDGARFTRYTAETGGGISFMRDPRTIRVSVRVTDQRVDSGRDKFMLSDMSRLGGRDGLAGFSPGRFHDLDLLYTKVQYVFPLARLFEFEVHSEWGAVYPDIWSDAKLNTLKNSWGLSLRFRNDWAPHGALGFDMSSEGMRIMYALGRVE